MLDKEIKTDLLSTLKELYEVNTLIFIWPALIVEQKVSYLFV